MRSFGAALRARRGGSAAVVTRTLPSGGNQSLNRKDLTLPSGLTPPRTESSIASSERRSHGTAQLCRKEGQVYITSPDLTTTTGSSFDRVKPGYTLYGGEAGGRPRPGSGSTCGIKTR